MSGPQREPDREAERRRQEEERARRVQEQTRPREIELIFADGEQPIPAADLGRFISLFNACYHCATFENGTIDIDATSKPRRLTRPYSRAIAPGISFENFYLLELPIGRQPLLLNSISKQSPLTMKMFGLAVFLSTAVVISGGDISVGPTQVSVRLPPLATTIDNLRKALSKAAGEPMANHPLVIDNTMMPPP
jgi:hypothetical protein